MSRPAPHTWRALLIALGLAALAVLGPRAGSGPDPVAEADPAPISTPASAAAPVAGEVRIEVLDVGQGDAVLIRSPEGKTALVDAGPHKDVVERLRERGVSRLDLVVVSHHHTDHYGGMDDVIRAFKPRYFLATDSAHATSTYLKLLRLVRDEGLTALRPANQARRIELGSVVLTVLPQPPEDREEENNNSIGLRVQHGAVAVLMTGDSEEVERRWWVANCPDLMRDCQVLKLAHHGSRNGTDPALLELVRPRLAVVSLGAGNSYGHPHAEVLSLLDRYGIPLRRTDQLGTIVLRSDGRTIRVETTRGGAPMLATTPAPAPTSDRAVARTRAATTTARPDTDLVDLNAASARELETLPGVGPATARRIIENRPYRSVDDLDRATGIGAARIARFRDQVMVR